MLLQRRVLGKTKKLTRKLLNTPKIAEPKALAYFYIHPIDPPKAGQFNSINFIGYKLLLHCDDLLPVTDMYYVYDPYDHRMVKISTKGYIHTNLKCNKEGMELLQ